MAMRLTFKEVKQYLSAKGYTGASIKHVYAAVREMDNETRLWLLTWFFTGKFPKERVEGITVKELIDQCGFEPFNAFITIDWLKTDPDTAKFFLTQHHISAVPGEAFNLQIAEKLEKENGIKPDLTQVFDESDIII